MLTVRLKFPAENVIIDQQTQDVAAFGIISTGMKAVSFPVFLRRLCYLVFWDRSPEDAKDYDAAFSLKLGQTEIAEGAITLNFGGDLSHRTLVRIEGVVIPEAGTLEFSVVAGGVTASYPVEVETVQAAVSVVPAQ
jgi:hypothetical protein